MQDLWQHCRLPINESQLKVDDGCINHDLTVDVSEQVTIETELWYNHRTNLAVGKVKTIAYIYGLSPSMQ